MNNGRKKKFEIKIWPGKKREFESDENCLTCISYPFEIQVKESCQSTPSSEQ